jgi:hypothetical protein
MSIGFGVTDTESTETTKPSSTFCYLIVPQHISRVAFFSAPFLICAGVMSHIYNYVSLTICLSGLLITSIMYWNKIQKYSIIKMVDIGLAISVLLIMTGISMSDFDEQYKRLWNQTVFISIVMYFINNILFYYQILPETIEPFVPFVPFVPTVPFTEECNVDADIDSVATSATQPSATESGYWYFSLVCTRPNTADRERAYYRSTYTHMFFLHMLPTMIFSYCMIMSNIPNNQSNPQNRDIFLGCQTDIINSSNTLL